jgi:hypothetical protein
MTRAIILTAGHHTTHHCRFEPCHAIALIPLRAAISIECTSAITIPTAWIQRSTEIDCHALTRTASNESTTTITTLGECLGGSRMNRGVTSASSSIHIITNNFTAGQSIGGITMVAPEYRHLVECELLRDILRRGVRRGLRHSAIYWLARLLVRQGPGGAASSNKRCISRRRAINGVARDACDLHLPLIRQTSLGERL